MRTGGRGTAGRRRPDGAPAVELAAGAGKLAGATVSARVIGEAKGPKIRGFTYKNKSRGRKSWGHRQHYTTIEITGISRGEG